MHLGTSGFVCRCSGWEYFTVSSSPLQTNSWNFRWLQSPPAKHLTTRCLSRLIELSRKINVDKKQDYTVTAYHSQLDSTWSVFMSILRFNATVPWNGQSIVLSVTHGCVHDSRSYLFTITVFHGFFLLRFIIIVIFIKIFVLIFFCRFLWQRQEDRNTSNLMCSVQSTWRISPSESCLGRVTRLARNCRKQRGHDYESVISTLLIVVCECSRLLSPNAAANGGREVGVFVGYCQSVVCRLNKRTSYTDYILAKKVTCHLVTYLKWPCYIFPLNAMPNLPCKQLCVKYLRVTVSYRVKQWNSPPIPRTPPPTKQFLLKLFLCSPWGSLDGAR